MTERMRRPWAASEALALPRGGLTLVAPATGMSRTTLWAGVRELRNPSDLPPTPQDPRRCRRPGGGRHLGAGDDPRVLEDLERLVNPATRGDPRAPLRWTCKSTRTRAEGLRRQGHDVSHQTVGLVLQAAGYSLQSNRKTREGGSHPDRDAQFEFINARARAHQRRGQPVVAVDTQKQESIGDFKTNGEEWPPEGQPEEVRAKDFLDKRWGKAIPSGVYDQALNQGWVSVGIDHDTAAFATETIRRWWDEMGRPTSRAAKELLITADGGGSNGTRNRLWKVCLQRLADETGLRVGVGHFPPGTSKGNQSEHRMFCHLTQDWRGRPLTSRAVVANLIGNTRTKTGPEIHSEWDENAYQTAIKVRDVELAAVRLKKDRFHGEWNYTRLPRK
jgi:Rhodopirellula transposase DDE domain